MSKSLSVPPQVKKGRGQRKNKRDKAGRARHLQDLPLGYNWSRNPADVNREQFLSGGPYSGGTYTS